jgi:hypothetical protein
LQQRLDKRIDAEVSPLKVKLADLHAAFHYHLKATTDEFIGVHDFLWPLVRRVFPGFAKVQRKLGSIVPPHAADPRIDRDRPCEDKSR